MAFLMAMWNFLRMPARCGGLASLLLAMIFVACARHPRGWCDEPTDHLEWSSAHSAWPTWRYDAARSGYSPTPLAKELYLQWDRELTPIKPAWPEDPRLQFDQYYQPVSASGLVVIGSPVEDTVTAYDLGDGQEHWTFFADGPVRFAPIIGDDCVYFGSDDGCVYCLAVEDGRQLWKFNAAPGIRKVLGNGRMISAWPIRGGPVLHAGKLYFVAGAWPSEGSLLYALDASTGAVASVANDSERSIYSPQLPIRLTNAAPNGYLVVSKNLLLIPSGRSQALAFDLVRGDFLELNYSGSGVDFSATRGLSDWHVVANDELIFHGGHAHRLDGGGTFSTWMPRPVICENVALCADKGLLGTDLSKTVVIDGRDRRGRKITKSEFARSWRLDAEPLEHVHMAAGNRVYGSHREFFFAIDRPETESATPQISWRSEIDGGYPSSMIASEGRLIVVSTQNKIYCYGPDPVAQPNQHAIVRTKNLAGAQWNRQVTTALEQAADLSIAADDDNATFALVLGVGSGELISELARQTNLRLVVVDPDAGKIERCREQAIRAGNYGTRFHAICASLRAMSVPPNWASLVTSEEPLLAGNQLRSDFGCAAGALRPYGGICIFPAADTEDAVARLLTDAIIGVKYQRRHSFDIVIKPDAPPGAGNWTHEYGDAANKLASADTSVRLPLSVAWFGGGAASPEFFYDRHEWGPSPLVVDGRMFLQGPGRLAAIDIYTGRIIWQQALLVGESPGRRGSFYDGMSRGYHFCADSDGVYLSMPDRCIQFDPRTGDVLRTIRPRSRGEQFGRVSVAGDSIIMSVFLADAESGLPTILRVFDRTTGKIRWEVTAKLGFPVTAASSDTVFCFDAHLEKFYNAVARRGLVPEAAAQKELRAFELRSGKERWTRTTSRVVTWLSAAVDQNVLFASNKVGIDALEASTGEPLWTQNTVGKGFGGHPENYWDRIVVLSDRIVDQRGPARLYDIRSGNTLSKFDSIAGAEVDWSFSRLGHHCNYAVGNESLLTFRANCAAVADVESGETCELPGFRPGCRNSLLPAGGVLNAPNMAQGCLCAYSIFTSLAFYHDSHAEQWFYAGAMDSASEVRKLGLNFSAPGDRIDHEGTRWVAVARNESVGGVSIDGQTSEFRLHSEMIAPHDFAWVAAYGLEGVKSIKLPLHTKESTQYRVRLIFCEPHSVSPGERVFDVWVEDECAFSALDVVKSAGGRNRVLVRETLTTVIDGQLDIRFERRRGKSVLCGVEVTMAAVEE